MTELLQELRERTNWRLPGGRLSPSKIAKFRACPACFKARYVDMQPSPYGVGAAIGAAVHKGVEIVRRRILNSQPSLPVIAVEEVDLGGSADAASDEWETRLRRANEKESVLDLGDDYADWGQAKDDMLRYLEWGLPRLLKQDLELGLRAVEARAWGLGQPLDLDEQNWFRRTGITPVFPFQFEAYIDCLYGFATGDLKVMGKASAPTFDYMFQQMLYSLSWYKNGEELQLRINQIIKHKELRDEAKGKNGKSFYTWIKVPTPEEYEEVELLVLSTAADIDRAMRSGYFPVSPGWKCDREHFQGYWQPS